MGGRRPPEIVDENVAAYEKTRDALTVGAPITVEGTMEYAPQIIHSMVTGTPRTVYGNVPNRALIDNLPTHGVVEVPCLVDSLGVQPTRVGSLPPQLAALNRTYLSANDLVVRAAIENEPRHIKHAAMTDPATASTLPVEDIWRLCDDMDRPGAREPPAEACPGRGAVQPQEGDFHEAARCLPLTGWDGPSDSAVPCRVRLHTQRHSG
ncbi:alpha-galactosidase/6-phospho-beta-glucosidase family protein [Streptomyces canus]|uniref:Alpha-galactosidase/6-phospho-beta-glucosidase family protein n=1 Tax=Streptomyces canus TaxID=58343 RepID=A0AAW8F461_9ACTN|nr:alpha-galactosidase/6-phospho-beta-glucosidase family protein [Streptomyces canus]